MPEYQGHSAISIEAPIDRVYAYLADFRKHPEWAKNLRKVTQVTPGPITVGSVFKTQEGVPPVRMGQKMKMMISFMQGLLGGAKPYSEATITALESPGRIAWQAGIPKGAGFFNFAEWEFVLEAQGDATQLTQHFHWKPQTPTAERMVGAAQNKITALVVWETESDAQTSIEGYLSQYLPKGANFLASQSSAETLEVILRA